MKNCDCREQFYSPDGHVICKKCKRYLGVCQKTRQPSKPLVFRWKTFRAGGKNWKSLHQERGLTVPGIEYY